MADPKLKNLYQIPVLSKALDVLELLQAEGKPLSLENICRRTAIPKATVYRVLKTFTHRGYLAQTEDGLYRFAARPHKVRFGYGAESAEMPFSEAVTQSLRDAALANGVELVVLDNRYDAATAVKNAEEFVRQAVDLVIEFQVNQDVAPIIGDRIAAAGIPLIAVDIPHPHATYFGVDNFRVGFEAGECLAAFAQSTWKGKIDYVLALDLEDAGALVQSRTTGSVEGIRSRLKRLRDDQVVRINGRGMRERSHQVTLDFLRRHPRASAILIAAANDTSGLGALQAVRELKREKHVAIAGQDCLPEALAEINRPASRYIASVSHEASSYGPNLVRLGLGVLRGELVPPYNYVAHRLVTGRKARRTGSAGK